MKQINKNYISWWDIYRNHVREVVLNNEPYDPEKVSYWRNAGFCTILTYLTPLSVIALIPSVFMAFMGGLLVVGFTDLFIFFTVVIITVGPGIKLEIRKALFIFLLYCLSVILLYFLPLPGPGLLFLLSVTIFSSLIYSTNAGYFSAWTNTVICVCFALLIYLEIESPVSSGYNIGSWIATSSNLVLLSFASAKCLDLLLAGLTNSLNEHRISEEKLEKANRHYQFISQINQTIVHVKDAETLFRDSCRIALEFGKYKMAWIGSFETAEKKLTILDSCGISEQDIILLTDVPYEANTPQNYVLRTGKYFISNDIENSLEIETWKPFAEKHHIRSCIVLPIKKSGSIFGTFNLYASELNYFSNDDIALLKEVTGDISFALDLFEKAERHKEAEIQLQKNFEELEAVSNQQSAILNTLPASIALLDNEGNIVKVNDEWILFGKADGLIDSYPHLDKNYIEISEKSFGRDEKEGKQMSKGLQEILSGERDYFTMEYSSDSSTEKRWYKAEVRPFKSNFLTGAVVMHIDISERKKAEAEILLLINNTEEAFILLNNNLQIISFNNQFNKLYKKYFGLKIQKGESILDYAQPHRREIVASIYKKVLEGNVEESEIIVPYLNNTTKYFSLKYTPAKDELGNIFGAFVTAIDVTEKKKAEEQKEFDRRDKEALINSTEDLIWSISKDFKLIAANKSFIKEIAKYTGVEIKQGEDFLKFDIFPPEFLIYWKEHYNRAFTGESFKIEIYTPPSTRMEESWNETSFSPLIVNEQIAGIACYSRNITERKKAEEKLILTSTALKQALNDLNKIMDSSLDVICAVDVEGIFLKVSAASETVWGYKPEELIGKPIFNIVYPEDFKKTELSASSVMAGNNLHNFENRYVRKDGSLVPIEWSARWDAKDQIRYGVARDVSEKKRLEKAVENERRRFYDLFSEAPSSMGVLSGPNHVFEIVNPLYLQLIGKKDIIGKTVKEVLPEAVDQGLIELLDGVYQTGKTFSSNEMLVKLDTQGNGQLVDKYLNYMYQAHRTERDKINGILFFAVDVTEQVLLRQKIEESERRLKEAQAIAHISNWEIDILTNSHTWSDEFYKIFGIDKISQQPSAEAFYSFIHPEDRELVQNKLKEAFKTSQASSMNFRFLAKNGNLKYGYGEWRIEIDKNHRPIRLYGILQDVTEQKSAELILIESESRLAEAQALAKIGNWETDLINCKVIWSAQTYHIFEGNPDDLDSPQPGFLSFVHPDDRAKVEDAFNNSFAKKSINYIEHRIITKTGEVKFLEELWQIFHDNNDIPVKAVGTCQDITERKESDNEIKFKAELLDTIGQAVIATDLDGNITFWNRAAIEIYGWTLEEAIGKNILELTPSVQTKVEAELLIENLSQGGSWSGEFYVKRKNGSVFPAFVSNSPVFDEFGKQIGIIGVSNDISERKENELKLSKITNDLLQRYRDLEQFTFIISHNLRAPTANILGLAECLQDETLTLQEQNELLQGLASSVSGLDSIIKDINSILQVNREINEKKEIISFSKLVNDIIISIENIIDKHNVYIKIDFSQVDEIFSLKVYIHSIFYNLISNSIKYRKPDAQPLIEIKSKKENGKIILSFKDNGLGIDMESNSDKVFGLYKRFHSHVEGKGMGLFMVKTQVEAIGGTITLASELNKGTEFTIVFEN